MTVDAAKDGKDAFAVQIIDTTNFMFEQVACSNLQIDYLRMPAFIYEWAEYYNFPYLIIENNEGAGQSIADQMFRQTQRRSFQLFPRVKRPVRVPSNRVHR